MRYFVGITDRDWYSFLAMRKPLEVNFWRPSATTAFKAIEPGAPFLFKLKKPEHCIVGGGYFVGYVRLPLSIAWADFAENNGVPDYETLREKISHYRETNGISTVNPEIGCIILTQPFFFEQRDWIRVTDNWGSGIVQGKGFDTNEPTGAELWGRVEALLHSRSIAVEPSLVKEEEAEFKSPVGGKYLRNVRLGQGAFRAMIMEKYKRTCCITGETTVPVLQAAHILPVSKSGDHRMRNGLLMRADMHILFDQGLIGISPDYRIKVSSTIRESYLNGRVYYAHDGHTLRSIPDDSSLHPDPALLDWHLKTVFVP